MKYSHVIVMFVSICLLTQTLFAQLWYKTQGLVDEDRAWAVDTDEFGNVYWAVIQKDVSPFFYFNITLFKISPESQILWQTPTWGGAFNDIAFVAKVEGNKVYLGGRQDSTALPNQGDALLMSFNTDDGQLNWYKVWSQGPGYEEIDGLIVEPDGLYLSGWTQGLATDMDFLISKASQNGQLLWTNSWDYENLEKFDGANGHHALDDNYIYIAGHINRTNIASFDGDMGLACFDRTNGDYQWHVTWGGWLYDDALGMTMSADSMLYVVGYTGSFGNGSQNYLNKYNRNGELQWSRLWGGTGAEDARAVVADADSIVYVVGATSSYGSGDYDVFVLKYTAEGELLDTLLWGGAYKDVAHDAVMFGDYLYITGETGSYGNGQSSGNHKTDGLLLKINARTMQAPDATITGIVELPDNLSNDWAALYPNPNNGSFKVILPPTLSSKVDLNIFDLSGKQVFHQKLQTITNAIHANMPMGMYFYVLSSKEHGLQSGKLIVQ